MTNFFLLFLLLATSLQAEPLFAPYHDNQELNTFIEGFDSKFSSKTVLAVTHGGNKVTCITLKSGKTKKPAILLMGDTNPASPVGTEILIKWLQKIAKDKKALEELLEKQTIHLILRPFPDSVDGLFADSVRINKLNAKKVDTDSDLEMDEDGFEDLNKDGFITLMRVKDENGTHQEHKDSPFLMVKGNNKDKPLYKVFSEGLDNDKDEKFNEDPEGGVNPNRNFSFEYPYFQKDAGPHQMSENEVKAIADFCFNRPEIYLVFSFGEEDNLIKAWKEDQQKKKSPIRITTYKEDEVIYSLYSKKFNEAFKLKPYTTNPSNSKGSFAHWAYFHFGRISLTAIPWEIPIDKIEGKFDYKIKEIKWLQKNRPQALVKWQKYKHPDFPDSDLEIGGIKPFYRQIPNIEVCEQRAEAFNIFLEEASKIKPQLSVKKFSIEKLNDNLSRITLQLKNTGMAPLRSKIGQQSKKMYPLNLSLKLPEKWELYNGHKKIQIGGLNSKEEKEVSWLVLTNNKEGKPQVSFSCPQIIDFTVSSGEIK